MVAQVLYPMPDGRLAKEQPYISMNEKAISNSMDGLVLPIQTYKYCAS